MATTLPAEDDEYEIPLRDQRYFGAGIKRKRIQFVPSSSTHDHQQSTSLPTTSASSSSAADKYLSIVLKNNPTNENLCRPTSAPPTQDEGITRPASPHAESTEDVSPSTTTTTLEANICPTCHRPIPAGQDLQHQSSLTHQISLTHSHPPSHLDRKRKGFAVLESQGWDPDSRVGLGASGNTGRLYPIRAQEKKDRVGLGGRVDIEGAVGKAKAKVERLDAGRVREQHQEGRKKAEGLRNAFYRSEEVERYLGQSQGHEGLDLEALRRAKRRI
ncbi:hypothetical protein D0862_06993 [Hortaea werneckii]|uniref:G-patch domain-containing protein n=1 Tax=Hortaea werneckii TaxID=91943 RepID=A0A3M7GG23_HORWE|nr:hypothetical protein D0862_06993 [Hortaea werneckii]